MSTELKVTLDTTPLEEALKIELETLQKSIDKINDILNNPEKYVKIIRN